MIGQKRLLLNIDKLIADGTFPRFSIIQGESGSERNLIAQYVADKMRAVCVNTADVKVETIRDIITNSYKVNALTVYNIQDADNMSLQAKNALLKVTEESPNKSFFIMTLDSEVNTLATLRSRAYVFDMQLYSSEEIKSYCQSKYDCFYDVFLAIVNTPGDVDLLVSYDADKFYSFMEKVVDNIATASGSNALKIAQSVKLKAEGEGYDLKMFWRMFHLICNQRNFFIGQKITSKYLSKLRIKSINKAMLFDSWVFEIRQGWSDGCR